MISPATLNLANFTAHHLHTNFQIKGIAIVSILFMVTRGSFFSSKFINAPGQNFSCSSSNANFQIMGISELAYVAHVKFGTCGSFSSLKLINTVSKIICQSSSNTDFQIKGIRTDVYSPSMLNSPT